MSFINDSCLTCVKSHFIVRTLAAVCVILATISLRCASLAARYPPVCADAVASTHTANMAVITAFFILFILFIPKILGREDKCLVKLSRRGQLGLPAKLAGHPASFPASAEVLKTFKQLV